MRRPDTTAPLLEVALWIRSTVPSATVEDRRTRQAIIDDVLDERRVWRRDDVWHTAQLADGRITTAFADSTEQAELKISVVGGLECIWVVRDPDHAVLFEYFPEGHRNSEDAQRTFALSSPRRPRASTTDEVPRIVEEPRSLDTRRR